MHTDLVRHIASLLAQQKSAYESLHSLMEHLSTALMRGEPTVIESLTRAGETELFRMRARLLEITTTLSEFGRIKSAGGEPMALDAETRESFEAAAEDLIASAQKFELITRRAKALAIGGSSFAAASIQMCGVPPSTYKAPVLRHAQGAGA